MAEKNVWTIFNWVDLVIDVLVSQEKYPWLGKGLG